MTNLWINRNIANPWIRHWTIHFLLNAIQTYSHKMYYNDQLFFNYDVQILLISTHYNISNQHFSFILWLSNSKWVWKAKGVKTLNAYQITAPKPWIHHWSIHFQLNAIWTYLHKKCDNETLYFNNDVNPSDF